MIKNGDLPAMPINYYDDYNNSKTALGLTKREELSARFVAAMISSPNTALNLTDKQIASIACERADALLAEWAK